jgi:hypothetical protein
MELDGPLMIFGGRPIMGTVSETSLRARKRIWYGNSFQTILSATLLDDNNQTRILCIFRLRNFVRVFSAVWLAFVFLIGGAMFSMSLFILIVSPTTAPRGIWGGVVIPPLMVAFFVGLLMFGRYLARDERDFLLRYLHTVLGAQRV